MIVDAHPGKREISVRTVYDYSLRDISQDTSFLEQIKDAEVHTDVLWDGIRRLEFAHESHIPRILGIIELLNVAHPHLLAITHSHQIAAQYESMLTNGRFKSMYLDMSEDSAKRIVADIHGGGYIGQFIDWAQIQRSNLGIATPVPIKPIMERIHSHLYGADAISSREWTEQTIDELSTYLSQHEFEEIDTLYSVKTVFNTTGYNRYKKRIGPDAHTVFDKLELHIPTGGRYLEVGASLGILAVDIKKRFGFSEVVATDIMSKEEAALVSSVADYVADSRVDYTHHKRADIESHIDVRLWNHNILTQPVRNYIPSHEGFMCFGLHNLTVHLLAKDVVIGNTTEGLLKDGDIIWISGGYCANDALLRHTVWKRTSTGMTLAFAESAKTYKEVITRQDLLEAVIKSKT